MKSYKCQSQIELQKEKAALPENSKTNPNWPKLNNKYFRLKGKKRKLYQILTFVAAAWAFFMWLQNQDLLPVHTTVLQAGTSSLPHLNTSLMQTWPCAPKLPSPENKAFTASLRTSWAEKIKSDVKKVYIFHCYKLPCVLPPEMWVIGFASQDRETRVVVFGKANETGGNNHKAAMHDNIICFLC